MEQIMELKKYLRIIVQKKQIAIVTALSIFTVFVVASFVLPKSYEATTTVLIERNVITNLMQGIAVTTSIDERLRVLQYAIKGRSLLENVVRDVDFPINKADQAEVNGLIENLQQKTDIRMSRENMFTVTYANHDPQIARDYVDTLVKRYIQMNIGAKRYEASVANKFLTDEIKDYKGKIDKVDEEIINIRKAKGIYAGVDEGAIIADIKGKQERIEDLELQKMELLAKKSRIEKQLKTEKPYTMTLFSRVGDESMSPENRLIFLQKKLNDLMLKYTDNYPEVVSVKAEINTVRAQLKAQNDGSQEKTGNEDELAGGGERLSTLNPVYQQLKEELARVENEIAGNEAKQHHYRNQTSAKEADLRSVPLDKKKISDLEKQRDSYKELYQKLIDRLNQSEVANKIEMQDKADTLRIVDPAVVPIRPVSPKKGVLLLMGLLCAIAGGPSLVIILDYMDNTLKSIKSLREFNVPILATVSRIVTEEERMRCREQDRRLFIYSGAYLACVLSVFIIVPLVGGA